MNLGCLPENSKKVNTRGCMQRFTIERGNLLSTDLWVKPQTNGFHFFFFWNVLFFVADRSFTADGGPLQPTGGVKTTPHKARFRSVKYTRNLDSDQN